MKPIAAILVLTLAVSSGCLTPSPNDDTTTASERPVTRSPLILGHGVGIFRLGAQVYHDRFDTLENWVVQIQPKDASPNTSVRAHNNTLDCYLPGRGCTIWLKKKLPSRTTIIYDVICPTPSSPMKGLQPRDINNFWMASDPIDPNHGLFDSNRYTGAFKTYEKMHGYYASTGGGSNAKANVTTRMRRYPRSVNQSPVPHIALNDKDGSPGYLITPDKVMTIQLVAYDGIVQYIVDGKLIYQIAPDDRIQIESRDTDGNVVAREAIYDVTRFPVYDQGYFGFRMVGTHHIYSNLRVFTLEPDAP